MKTSLGIGNHIYNIEHLINSHYGKDIFYFFFLFHMVCSCYVAEKYGSKIFPQELPKRLATHINTKTGKVVYTKVLGRFLGREDSPVGWDLLMMLVWLYIIHK